MGLAALLWLACPAHAGSFSVNPVRVTLSAQQSVAALSVRNVGTEPSVIQLETYTWTQQGGQDQLATTQQILATPPILMIPPGATRIIRVGLLRPADPHRELTYRLILREVPPPHPIAQALRVALRISLPVFVDPPHPVAAQLQWRALRMPDGHLQLEAQNGGTAHIQLSRLEVLSQGSKTPLAVRQTADYVLPGSTRDWALEAANLPAAGTLLHVTAETDSGTGQADLTLGGPRQAGSTEASARR